MSNDLDTKRLRAVFDPPPTPTCDPDCEHIECAYTVACERHWKNQVAVAHEVLPQLLDLVDDLRSRLAALAAAATHCRMCRDCGDGPCCALCEVEALTAELIGGGEGQ